MSDKLDEAAVRHVAHLARLTVTDAEVARFAEQLTSILGYVEKLDELNAELETDDVPPTAHPLPIQNVLREDETREPWDAERALATAPNRQNGFFKVPKVLDQGSS